MSGHGHFGVIDGFIREYCIRANLSHHTMQPSYQSQKPILAQSNPPPLPPPYSPSYSPAKPAWHPPSMALQEI